MSHLSLQNGHHSKHRWMLLLPFVALLIGLTLWQGAGRALVSIMATEQKNGLSWSGGMLKLEPGMTYEIVDESTVSMSEGSALAYAPVMATVRAGQWDVTVWHGAAHVTLQSNDALTVAAFEVSVVLSNASGTVIVSPYSQWKSHKAMQLDPLHDPTSWMKSINVRPLPEHFRSEQEAIVRAWIQSEASHVQTAQAEPSRSMLAQTSTKDLAALALLPVPSYDVLSAVRSRGLLRLYTRVHPQLRSLAWVWRAQNAPLDEDTWLSVLSFPAAEVAGNASSPIAVKRWGEALGLVLQSSSGSVQSDVIVRLEKDIQALAEQPLRALRFAEALLSAIDSSDVLLTSDARAAQARLELMTAESLRASLLPEMEVPADEVDTSDVSQDIVADPALEQRARDVLLASGAMFTGETTVKTAGDGAVDVSNIVFGFPSGDRLLHLRLTPKTLLVRAIIDGAVQPNPVLLQEYLDWEASR